MGCVSSSPPPPPPSSFCDANQYNPIWCGDNYCGDYDPACCLGDCAAPPPGPPTSPPPYFTPYSTPYLDPITLFIGIAADPNSGVEPLDTDITASVSGTATGPINYHFWWNCADSGSNVAQAEADCGTLPAPTAGLCVTNGFGVRCTQVGNTSQTISFTYLEGIYRAKVIGERSGAPNTTASVTISVAPLFVPQVIPNPFEASDPAVAVFDAITALVVIGTPVYAITFILAGYYLLFNAASAAGAATSRKIILYGTIGYGTIIVSWMTVAVLTGILF